MDGFTLPMQCNARQMLKIGRECDICYRNRQDSAADLKNLGDPSQLGVGGVKTGMNLTQNQIQSQYLVVVLILAHLLLEHFVIEPMMRMFNMVREHV